MTLLLTGNTEQSPYVSLTLSLNNLVQMVRISLESSGDLLEMFILIRWYMVRQDLIQLREVLLCS